jgi:hypothetical protein
LLGHFRMLSPANAEVPSSYQISTLMSLAATFDLNIKKMDVKTTFLHGDLEEDIYMKQPEGFAVKGKRELVNKLKRSPYGLKQSLRMWY